jgi:hypothetical protein
MPLALPLRLMTLLYVRRPPFGRPTSTEGTKRRLDLCALPQYLRRDIGFESFDCETREDWRSFR